MSVEITFHQEGGQGLVAVGTSLWDAARRLGVHLPSDCDGRGECDACVVSITDGLELLSPANDREQKMLGDERLANAQRLACQTTVDRAGSVSARPVLVHSAAQEQQSEKPLRELSVGGQVGAFIEVQAVAITEAVNTLRGHSNELIERFLNLSSSKTNATEKTNPEGTSAEKSSSAAPCE